MQVQISGKTFILGEYAVLQGGPALIACTSPYFTLVAEDRKYITIQAKSPLLSPLQREQNSDSVLQFFHPESPAGKFLKDHQETFEQLELSWSSPYPQGGFGGSTAEFLGCYQLYHQLNNLSFSQEDLYQTYLKYAYNHTGIPPSGADLLAQTQRKIVYFQSPASPLITFSWPFKDFSLLLFKTPNKLPTHQYLETLNHLPDFTVLSNLTRQGYEALQKENTELFIDSINQYASTLFELKLTTESTNFLLNKLKQHPACLAIKGCGALGADVIAAMVLTSYKEDFCSLSQSYNLSLIATDRNLI